MIDFRVDHEEKVYPMVPAGAGSADMIDAGWIEDDNAWVGGGRLMARSDPPTTRCRCSSRTSPACSRASPGLFSRRGFNIESLAVGPTEREDRSRITIRVDCSEVSIDQVIKQLYKLINVLKVNEMTAEDAIERELLLVKVTADAGPARRAHPPRRGVRRARRPTSAPHALMFEIVEHPDKLDAFEELLRPYGIKETVRTGRVAMRRALGERRDRDAGACASWPDAQLRSPDDRPANHARGTR